MIKYIKYKNKEYPIRVAYRALKMFEKDTGVKFDDLGEGKGEMEYYEPLLFHSLVAGQIAIDRTEEMPFTKDDMIDVLDECWLQFLEIIPEFFPKEEGANEGNVLKKKPNRQQKRALKK